MVYLGWNDRRKMRQCKRRTYYVSMSDIIAFTSPYIVMIIVVAIDIAIDTRSRPDSEKRPG